MPVGTLYEELFLQCESSFFIYLAMSFVSDLVWSVQFWVACFRLYIGIRPFHAVVQS